MRCGRDTIISLVIVCLACVSPGITFGQTAPTDEVGHDAPWTALFDGKSFDNFEIRGGKATYEIDGDEIVGTSVPNTPNTFLCTKRDYSDFVLEYEFKVHPELNAGVQIRSQSLAEYKKGRVHGYQVEIDPSRRGWTAGIYDESRRGWLNTLEFNTAARYAFRQNEWNHIRVEAIGPSIRTWLNGVPAADLHDSMTLSGFIGLQVHGVGGRQDPVWIRWRNLRIKDLGAIIDEDAPIQKIQDGFQFTEGPAPGPDGNIYFSDIPNERIHKYDVKTGEISVHREDTGKANGLMFAPGGSLIACQGGSRQLTQQDFSGKVTVLADKYDGKLLNSPNDLAIDGKGGIYFTDPRYGNRDDIQQPVEGVYYLPRNGELIRVIDDLVRPNGLVLSLDRKSLYVADNGAKTIWKYDVKNDGTLANGSKWVDMDGGGDGMTIDERGNVYCAGGGAVHVWNPAGELLTKIQPPEGPANCIFGGPDGKTLFMTARTGFYSVRMNVAGGR